MKLPILIAFFLFAGNRAYAQQPQPPVSGKDNLELEKIPVKLETNFADPDSLIHCFHKVLSGPAGARNWELYKSLFHEKAILGVVRTDAQGHQSYSSLTPEEYIKRNDEFFRTHVFYVEETHRITERFGDIMSLFSTYQFRVGGVQGQQSGRGINSFQLIHDAARWWIISIQYTNERPDLPIPKKYKGIDVK